MILSPTKIAQHGHSLSQDAYQLAEKLVTTYGLSDIGIVSFAPVELEPGSNRVAYGVGLYDADDELFGRNSPAVLMSPSDEMEERFQRATLRLVLQAYRAALVRGGTAMWLLLYCVVVDVWGVHDVHAQELLHCRREAHSVLAATLLEKKVVMHSELVSLVEQYPAAGEVPSIPEDVVRQLVSGAVE